GQIDGVVFAETFAEINKKYPGLVEVEQTMFVRGRIDRRRELPSIVVNEIFPVPEAVAKLTQLVIVKLRDPKISPETITELKPHLQKHRGNCECYLQVSHADKIVLLKLGRNHFVRPSTDLVNDLELLLGSGSVELRGAGGRRSKTPSPEQPRMLMKAPPQTMTARSRPVRCRRMNCSTMSCSVFADQRSGITSHAPRASHSRSVISAGLPRGV
ncbi:MAG TPA: hypothetical protein PKB10_06995, partial [Tepidisphaeraceae bacterium]|nr:hypothetical protein [Tepidisphaeraceae bacterium]